MGKYYTEMLALQRKPRKAKENTHVVVKKKETRRDRELSSKKKERPPKKKTPSPPLPETWCVGPLVPSFVCLD